MYPQVVVSENWVQKKNTYLVGGFNLPLWKLWQLVSWDDDILNWMESHNPFMFRFPPPDYIILVYEVFLVLITSYNYSYWGFC